MPLNPGDLLFVGWDSDNEDVAFIATVPVAAGEVIYFTDDERDASGFFGSEQLFEWTVPAGGIPIGTVVTLDMVGSSPVGASFSIGGAVDYMQGGGQLAGGNEMVWAFQGTRVGDDVTPTNFIGVIANEADGSNNQTPNLTGTGLTTSNGGAIIIDGDEDWMEYTADPTLPTPINREDLIASVTDLSNWSTADGTGNNNPNPGGVGFDLNFPTVVCFTSGTLIDTGSGARPVESLRVGDFVTTLDNDLQQIRWIGKRTIPNAVLKAQPYLQPIRIPKNAFGHGVPERDVQLSPQHRILVSGWSAYTHFQSSEILAPAKSLFEPIEVAGVTYIHILLDRHEILTSSGLKSESFHPGPMALNALDDPARQELIEIFPELGAGDLSHRKFARPVATVGQAKELIALP